MPSARTTLGYMVGRAVAVLGARPLSTTTTARQARTDSGLISSRRWIASYRQDLREIVATGNGVVAVSEAEDAGVPAVEVRKLAARGVLRGCGQGVYTDVSDEDLTRYEGVPATTVRRALEDLRDRMSPDRWQALVVPALRRELIGEQDIDTRRGLHPKAVDHGEKNT
jgi:hypothetical protein